MKIEFDHAKSDKNIIERGLPFNKTGEFDWNNAVYYADDRFPYPEERIIALGFINVRLHVICFTPIDDGVRIISFRKANKREIKYYEQETINR
ncbi:MAG: BrnT family toxin [Desulfobacterales bacterium]|nr:BrnT family toxin [Desulfobacterales bacterium]